MMADFSAHDLDRLLQGHHNGYIRSSAMELRALLAELEQDKDPEKKAALTEIARDLDAALEYELNEDSRGGEDYINDGVFHAME